MLWWWIDDHSTLKAAAHYALVMLEYMLREYEE